MRIDTAILKLGLAAFGLTFDGTIGDVIGSWLTSTWESIKAAMRAIIPDAWSIFSKVYKQGMLIHSSCSSNERQSTDEKVKAKAQRDLQWKKDKRNGMTGKSGSTKIDKLNLKAKAEENLESGFDIRKKYKFSGLSKNDIIKAR